MKENIFVMLQTDLKDDCCFCKFRKNDSGEAINSKQKSADFPERKRNDKTENTKVLFTGLPHTLYQLQAPDTDKVVCKWSWACTQANTHA